MPDPGSRFLYRLRDHIAGVNWRPTRFAEAVPNIRICGVCHMIPNRTVILPCGHFLCESCSRASTGDGGGMCRLDGKYFSEDECVMNPLPDRVAKDLKAHCWNQPHGCEFVGTMDAVLRHYEAECTFHLVGCHQCGVQVLHNEVVGHHVAGCTGGTPLPTTEGGGALTMGDLRSALEELKAFVRDPHHDQLSALQSQINQLMEQSRKDARCLMESMRLLTESTDDVKGEVTRMLYRTAEEEEEDEEDEELNCSREEARVGTSGGGCLGEFIPWRKEKMLILRRLEVLTIHSLNALEQLRQNNQPQGAPGVPVAIKPMDDFTPLSDYNDKLGLELGLCLNFQLRNAKQVLSSWNKFQSKAWAQQIMWDGRDRFFKVTFGTQAYTTAELYVRVECFCIPPTARLPSGTLCVTVLHKDSKKHRDMNPGGSPSSIDPCYGLFFFKTELEPLKDGGFLTDGELRIQLSAY